VEGEVLNLVTYQAFQYPLFLTNAVVGEFVWEEGLSNVSENVMLTRL
jgi:hypothetical protein